MRATAINKIVGESIQVDLKPRGSNALRPDCRAYYLILDSNMSLENTGDIAVDTQQSKYLLRISDDALIEIGVGRWTLRVFETDDGDYTKCIYEADLTLRK